MDKIALLRFFKTVTDLKNIDKAVELLSISKHDVVDSLKKLESNLGHKLFDNCENNELTLTAKGNTLRNLAIALLDSAPLSDTNRRTTIRLGMPTDYVSRYLDSLLMEFIREFTQINLSIDTDVSGNLLKRLHQGAFDMVIATHWQEPAEACKLFDRRFLWVASASGRAHLNSSLPIALYPENCPIRAQVFANHKLDKPPLNIVLTTPSPQALCEAVENDIAVAPIAEFRINDKMQVLPAAEFGLPELPLFNESIYLSDNNDSEQLQQLKKIIKASTEGFGGK
ncbi:LysR family transcriptional regulator [Shewanella corallii]|uniref:LysR family transcriptional regulator n=1 Tax=Shewanella corallii TaxID=560080 RepID=A0ABT0N9Z5_9GAMM|nr:LysR family transcriptional regulator [Shewanella corallii]MCL2915278.1 LysR family transcriptional regulator [Shewanella corallii]